MDSVEIWLLLGGAIVTLTIVIVLVLPALGGDWRRGNMGDTSVGGDGGSGGGGD